jgi:hypothetical protein
VLQRLQDCDLSDQSSRALVIFKHPFEPFARILLPGRLVADLHYLPVSAFAKLFDFGELLWHQELRVEVVH